jgi:hypothetical protein
MNDASSALEILERLIANCLERPTMFGPPEELEASLRGHLCAWECLARGHLEGSTRWRELWRRECQRYGRSLGRNLSDTCADDEIESRRWAETDAHDDNRRAYSQVVSGSRAILETLKREITPAEPVQQPSLAREEVTRLHHLVGSYEEALRASSLQASSSRTYVNAAKRFLDWLSGEYHPPQEG